MLYTFLYFMMVGHFGILLILEKLPLPSELIPRNSKGCASRHISDRQTSQPGDQPGDEPPPLCGFSCTFWDAAFLSPPSGADISSLGTVSPIWSPLKYSS